VTLGVIGSGYIAAVIPPEVITGWLGPDSGWFGVLTANRATRALDLCQRALHPQKHDLSRGE